MRGTDVHQESLFSYVSPESRIPKNHPLRPIRQMVDTALGELNELFEQIYATCGRPSIPPEKLLRALLLQVFYTIRSERLLVEQLDYNLLFRWFVGLSVDEPVWDHSTFSKNRDRLLASEVAVAFFHQVLERARRAGLTSDEHFSVDGTLIEAWASMKSFRRKDEGDGGDDPGEGGRNPSRDFRGEKRSNETHESKTDPDARLYRKGEGDKARLCYLGHVLMENRHGLVVDVETTRATGRAEREAAVDMLHRLPVKRRVTLGADKAYDTRAFVEDCRILDVTPHVAQNDTNRRSAIDGRTTRHPGYEVSIRVRKRIEEVFGWLKTVGGVRKTRYRGLERVAFHLQLTVTAWNLVRMRNLDALAPG
ncbi:MAG: IS5 family transposase [Deltaproteobacteria bacterium]|nr:MAG: IS5 family transposase [Deltaproteobacteria bacterium]